MEAELIDIKIRGNSFTAEVELKDRTRRFFGYPMGEGWENLIEGTPKFLTDIRKKLDEEGVAKKAHESKVLELAKDWKNKKF